jgi:carotenoid cleavage dioxygenase-like enzyme
MYRVVKVDNTAEEDGGMVGMVVLPPSHVCGEFSYVLRAAPSTAASKPEDDGWLVGFCTDESTMKSYFLVRFLF